MPISCRCLLNTIVLCLFGAFTFTTSVKAQNSVAPRATTRPAPAWSTLDFVQISEAPSLDVRYALRREGSTLRFVVEVENPPTGELPTGNIVNKVAKP